MHGSFLPRVETLGISISDATWLTPDESPEDRIFADLRELHSLSQGVAQEGEHDSSPPKCEVGNHHLRPVLENPAAVAWDVR